MKEEDTNQENRIKKKSENSKTGKNWKCWWYQVGVGMWGNSNLHTGLI